MTSSTSKPDYNFSYKHSHTFFLVTLFYVVHSVLVSCFHRQLESDSVFSQPLLSNSLLRALQTEFEAVCNHASSRGNVSDTDFISLAPVGSQLRVLALDQLLFVYRSLYLQKEFREKTVPQKHLFLANWVINIFFRLCSESCNGGRSTFRRECMVEYLTRLFSTHLIDTIVGIIMTADGQMRTTFMQLLASVSNSLKGVMRLSLSRVKIDTLSNFMFTAYDSHRRAGANKSFSPFFQALVELNVSIHFMQKESERKVHQALHMLYIFNSLPYVCSSNLQA